MRLHLGAALAREDVDRRDDDGCRAQLGHEITEGEGGVVAAPEVVELLPAVLEAVKLLDPLGREIGPGSEDHGARVVLAVETGSDDADGLEGLAHADLVGQHDTGALIEHGERAEHRGLLTGDLDERDAVGVGPRAEIEEGPQPAQIADAHDSTSLPLTAA